MLSSTFFSYLCSIDSLINNMEVTGKIIAVLPERGGTSARTGSEWKLGQYVLETLEQYPKKMAFEVFGSDRIAQFNIQVGDIMTVSFDIDAHEYQGRWFNSIRAWKVDRNPQPQTQTPPVAPPDITPLDAPQVASVPDDLTAGAPFPTGGIDDLPF